MPKTREMQKYMNMIRDFRKRHILVIGDIMLDEYVWGNATRISPEAPVPVVEVRNRSYHPGGAANSVSNILSLGAKATLMGVVGKDADGRRLKAILKESGINTDHVISISGRPTTSKIRIVAHGQQVMRADMEDVDKVSNRITGRMISDVEKLVGRIDGIAVSDYNKGVITPGFMGAVVTAAREAGKIVAADIKPPNRDLFKGVTIITPNRSEASLISGIRIKDEDTLHEAGFRIKRMLGLEAVLITLGEDGMALFRGDDRVDRIPAVASQVYDVTGAGDTVLSALTVALSSGYDILDSVKLANFAAGIVVRKRGTVSADAEELKDFIGAVLG